MANAPQSMRTGPPGVRTTAAVATTAVVVVAVIGAAVAGPWTLQERHWAPNIGPGSALPRPPIPIGPPATAVPPTPSSGQPLNLSWLAWVGLGLIVAACAVVVWKLWQRYRQTQTTEADLPLAYDLAIDGDLLPDVPVLEQGAAAAQQFLAEIGDPTDAIVAAWLALEDAAAASGVRRDPAQTPTEFTVSVLAKTKADANATDQLLHLYHRARFSRAGARPGDPALAARCLTTLAQDWKALARSAAEHDLGSGAD